MWQYCDELERRAKWWNQNQNDPHNIGNAVTVSLIEQKAAMVEVLVKNYGEREK